MRRTLTLVVSVGALAALVLTPLASGKAREVEVGDDFFAPTSLTIDRGTKLNFNWTGVDEHDIVKVKGPGKFFESGPITGFGVQYAHKFKDKGKYKLICSLHDGMEMNVKVRR